MITHQAAFVWTMAVLTSVAFLAVAWLGYFLACKLIAGLRFILSMTDDPPDDYHQDEAAALAFFDQQRSEEGAVS